MKITLPKGRGKRHIAGLITFANQLIEIHNKVGFKISSRGWCYQLEGFGLIVKSEFDRVQLLINKCRKFGILPINFTAEEESRKFSGVEHPETASPSDYLKRWLKATLNCDDYYTPDWWEGEEYYIQMVVEKIDLKTLFEPVCQEYHIPIATSKGWSSMLQRAEYAKRYKEAEDMGLKCVLLYCGDHDPDGLRISEFLRSNLFDLQHIKWIDGTIGYDPTNLIINRFGLNFDFIEKHGLTWIENLITGSGRNLANPLHRNFHQPYVQEYLRKYGERKCEANAIIIIPKEARKLCEDTIIEYLGDDALSRFQEKTDEISDIFDELRDKTGVQKPIEEALEKLKGED